MTDSIEPDFPEPTLVRRRRPARLFSVIAVTISCFLFAGAGCCFLTALIFRPDVVNSPAGADAVAAQIVDWTLPPDFSGTSGCTIDNPIFRVEIARFAQQQGRGHLVIAQLHWKWPVSGQRKQLQEFVDQYAPELKQISIDESETRMMTHNGLPAKFQIGRGEDAASTTKYRQIVGTFRGKQDDAILILQFEDGLLTDQQVDDFLKSIR